MIDISKYTSKSELKLILQFIYVHDIDGKRYAVATDAYSLARVEIPEGFKEIITPGFYTVKNWKDITKAINKMKLLEVSQLVKMNNAIERDLGDYPNYISIIPDYDTLEPFSSDIEINGNYLIDLVKDIQHPKTKAFSFSDLKHSKEKNMLYYKDANAGLDILIMLRNK